MARAAVRNKALKRNRWWLCMCTASRLKNSILEFLALMQYAGVIQRKMFENAHSPAEGSWLLRRGGEGSNLKNLI
jgi:hypothetical protein